MTIHITPEPEFSYVSFESNISSANYGDLIARVIETFQPGKFVVTIFANKVSFFFITSKNKIWKCVKFAVLSYLNICFMKFLPTQNFDNKKNWNKIF